MPLPLLPTLQTFPPGGNDILDANGQPTGLAYFGFSDFSLRSHVNATSLRFDHIFSPRFSVFFRWADTPSFGQTRQLWSLTRNQVNSQTFTGGVNQPIVRIPEQRIQAGIRAKQFDSRYANRAAQRLLRAPPEPGRRARRTNVRRLGREHKPTSMWQEPATPRATQIEEAGSSIEWNVRDTFSLRAGNHLFKIGLDQRRVGTSLP